MHNKATKYSLFLFLIFVVFACDKNDPSVNAARVRLKLSASSPYVVTTNENFIVKELHLDVNRIEVTVLDTLGKQSEWIPLEFKAREFNLLSLSGGKSIQIVDQYFPANQTITAIRLVFGEKSRAVPTTGVDNAQKLIIPDALKEGLALPVIVNLYSNNISSIVIDIQTAFAVAEVNGNYFLNPVSRVFPETFGGTLRGTVSPREASATVLITQETDTFFTIPEPEGLFFFSGLNEGYWKVHLLANRLSGFRDSIFTDSVFQGKVTQVSVKLLPAEPAEGEE